MVGPRWARSGVTIMYLGATENVQEVFQQKKVAFDNEQLRHFGYRLIYIVGGLAVYYMFKKVRGA